VNLQGYRYSQYWDLTNARLIGEPVVLEPGGSAVFAETLTKEEFAQWWGVENLPRVSK
jgi:hypothetical protein